MLQKYSIPFRALIAHLFNFKIAIYPHPFSILYLQALKSEEECGLSAKKPPGERRLFGIGCQIGGQEILKVKDSEKYYLSIAPTIS